MAVLAVFGLFYLLTLRQYDPWKVNIWAWTFGLLVTAATLGAVAHGFQMPEMVNQWLWRPLNLILAWLVALFVVAVVYDLWGVELARRVVIPAFTVGLIFFGLTLINPTNFLPFIIYEVVAMLFALGGYGWLMWAGRLPGAGWMTAGVLVTIIAAAVQALWNGKENPLVMIWQFDQNGVYHLIQMVGVALLLVGLRLGLLT